MNTNIEQIKLLKSARKQTFHNRNILERRIKQARNEINNLVRLRNAKPKSKVAEILSARIEELEKQLNEALS